MTKLSRITIPLFLLFIFNTSSTLDLLSCEEIDQIFTNATNTGEVVNYL